MRRLPPLAAIRAFEAAARTENFTAAAAELGMTQAAVSYQVKSLEERLGAPLFVREKGRVKLTPLGGRLLPALSNAFDSIEAAFASHRQEDESLLTITTTHTATAAITCAIGTSVSSRGRAAESALKRLRRNSRIALMIGPRIRHSVVSPPVSIAPTPKNLTWVLHSVCAAIAAD